MGGAILLFVVDRRIGDVEVVRDALSGEDVVATGPTLDAIRDGLAWVHAFSGIVAVACLTTAVTLWRLVRHGRPG